MNEQSRVPKRWDLLVSPGFLVAVLLLAVNDHVLKDTYGNWFTGKLSDFAGVFATALFLCAFAPRFRLAHCLGVGVAFSLFKLPIADAPLAAWNSLGMYPIARIVDPTDLLALLTLPVAWWYAAVARPVPWLRAARVLTAGASIAIFAATGEPRETRDDGSLLVVLSARSAVLAHLRAAASRDTKLRLKIVETPQNDSVTIVREMQLPGPTYSTHVVNMTLQPALGGQTVVTVLGLEGTSRTLRDISSTHLHSWLRDTLFKE